MKIRNILKISIVCLVSGLELTFVQPVRGQNYPVYPCSPFQYAIFYNGLLEFTTASPLSISGNVYANSNIYVGSASPLAFNGLVTTSGVITNPAWAGASPPYAGAVTFNGTPAPGYVTGMPAINLFLGTNYSGGSARQILYPPPAGESTTNPVSAQRYYNKADMVITVTDTNIVMSLKNSMYDLAPVILMTGQAGSSDATNWTNNTMLGFFLTTNCTFYDARQGSTNKVSQIDVGLLGTWIATNTSCISKWSGGTPFNGIIYLQDLRATNAQWMDCVRITNGVNITNGLYSSGLTVATPNPLYCWGNYNCPNPASLLSTNVTQARPASFVCDAFTILSSNWKDQLSTNSLPSRIAVDTTINAALITGNVPSTGPAFTQFSGGVQNLPRLLEDWSVRTLCMNSSLVCLYPSAQATAQWNSAGAYYEPPTRRFSFDQNYTNIAFLPPGAPLLAQPPATVILTNLTQAYTGSPLVPTVQTVPPGLNVSLEYAPGDCGIYFTNVVYAGMYSVIATINDPVYSGTASNDFTINAAQVPITVSNLVQTYDGTYKRVSVTTTPPGLQTYMTVNGWGSDANSGTNPIIGINAGSYQVIFTINGNPYYYDYAGSATNTFIILPAPATVTLANLAQTCDGTPKSVQATTRPAGLAVNITYNGSTNAPVNVGSYTVVGNINNPNYQGSAVTNTLVIAPPASMPITLGGSAIQANGTFQLNFTNTPSAKFSILGSADLSAPFTNWTVLGVAMEVSPGDFQFTDLQATNVSKRFYIIRSP